MVTNFRHGGSVNCQCGIALLRLPSLQMPSLSVLTKGMAACHHPLCGKVAEGCLHYQLLFGGWLSIAPRFQFTLATPIAFVAFIIATVPHHLRATALTAR